MFLVLLAVLIVAAVWFGIQVVPRLLRRHPQAITPVQLILDKRYIDPFPGDTSGQPQRFQLLLEDEDGHQVWQWCDSAAFSSAEPGDTFIRGEVSKR